MPDSSNNPNTPVGAMAPDASTSPVEWGPEIRVDGKRPEWLHDSDKMLWSAKKGWGFHEAVAGETTNWQGANGTVTIRLPADHPHYRQPTTLERDPALWNRMEALVRRMARKKYEHGVPDYDEARAIVADLPKPVDPDLLLAREIVAEEYGDGSNVAHLATQARSGEGDEWFHTKVALRAIRKLRAGEQA